jgi:hypothetical protein
MKKIIFLILILFFCDCATQHRASAYRDKQGLMLLDNKELHINRKFYNQKYYNPKKRNHNKILKKR